MSLPNLIGDENAHIYNETMDRICWCKKHRGELYLDRKSGKFKVEGGCSLLCIKALVLILKYSIREEKNREEIEKSVISYNM